ncbi:hypothetical protein GPJ56_008003 [Histomonas meleagridis]|uniref:uncharacterized protein n=1 Tax=Histomonas meleagridis TaxID=135588 RepID=UPI0035594196|nr:hypothetical protein GPJ56_008003 [Histomonas meleagridis]KAH0803945.1 hypothetical protein GO595_002775 [Histomonas meleagridis]
MKSHTKTKSYPPTNLDISSADELQIGVPLRLLSFCQLCGSMVNKYGEPFTGLTEDEADNPVVVREITSDSTKSYPFANHYSSSSGNEFTLSVNNTQAKATTEEREEPSDFIFDEFDPQSHFMQFLHRTNESRLKSIGYTYPSSTPNQETTYNFKHLFKSVPNSMGAEKNKKRPRSHSSNLPHSIASNVKIIKVMR